MPLRVFWRTARAGEALYFDTETAFCYNKSSCRGGRGVGISCVRTRNTAEERAGRKDRMENNLDYSGSEWVPEAPSGEPERQYYFMDRVRELVERKKREGYGASCLVNVIGCQMSAKDAEKLRGILKGCGYREAESEDDADVILFTTCTVRENANQKLYGRIGRLKHQCERRKGMILGITGCMMQEKDEVETIRKRYPYVKLIFGTHNVYKLAELLYRTLRRDERTVEIIDDTSLIVENLPSLRKTGFRASVNISYGCNNFCTYCIVPYVRGREKSRSSEEILRECRDLVRDGVKEIMLLGQNVNSYGLDREELRFPELLRRVSEIPGLRRIRFMTPNPKDFSEELIDLIGERENICRHIHLPLQSGSTEVLRRMNRHYTKESYLSLVRRIREKLPDVSLTTDIIVGFPGESERDFQDTMDVVRRVGFDSAFTFVYSKRSGTPAAKWEGVSEELVKDRFHRLLDAVRESSSENEGRDIGKVMEVLVEERDREKPGFLTGRLSNNILVHFRGGERLIGELVSVELLESRGFYYMGRLL